MRLRAALRRQLGRVLDDRGVGTVEFALVLPPLLAVFMGLTEIAFQTYMQSVLNGAVQKAARDGTLQNATASSIDAGVLDQMRALMPSAAFASGYPARRNYMSFGSISPEPFTDSNHNGSRDAGECFSDTNGNGAWDSDPGATGQGSASNVVLYTVRVSYPRLMPLGPWLGWGSTATISSSTILKNQPWAVQPGFTPPTVCT